ncbi:MAG: hypothetical protein KJ649_11575 [Proteobacteria bacterium]|nr:hypothetical protein [Pseudomonadota bacterium]
MNFQIHRVPKMGFGLSVLSAFPCFSSRMSRLIPASAAMTLLILFVCNPAARALDVDISHAPVEVYFSPNDGATTAIVREIDRAVVITGSFNFTKAAEEKNAENLLIIRSKELVKPYLQNWQRHREHSAA